MPYLSNHYSLMANNNSVDAEAAKAECVTKDQSIEVEPANEVVIARMDIKKHRFPCCIVWTPLPLLSWIIPFIGHMGIATTSGIIHDFAGPYFVSEDNMAFGWPTKYWVLDPYLAQGGPSSYDKSVGLASQEYRNRMHNLCCDNCHSHVAMALTLMHYENSTSWNMVKLCFLMMVHSKYVSFWAFLKTWLPFVVLATCVVTFACVFNQ